VRLEPRLALDGGKDGLELIRRIIGEAPDYLDLSAAGRTRGGALLLEANPGEMEEIQRLLENRGFSRIRIYQDLAGLDRVISARFGAET
jgi:release factor glutamine methyltransferase